MLSMLAATMFLLAFFVVPGPISRLLGAKFAGMFVATTGVVVLPVILGPTWRATLVAGADVTLLLAGAWLAGRFGFAREICAIWARRVAAAVSAVFFVAFAVLALMVASLDGRAVDTLPYDFLALVSAAVFAALLSRRQKQASTGTVVGTLATAPSQA